MRPLTLSTLLLALLTLPIAGALSGCIVAGATSNGHFFLFPGVGVLFLILIVFLLMRRR